MSVRPHSVRNVSAERAREASRRVTLANIRPGDLVRLVGQETPFEVVAADDPATLTLQTPSGAVLKAGRMTVAAILPAQSLEATR